MKKWFQILDGSSLKIIAMIFMVIDHIAAYLVPVQSSCYLPLRLIGRLSFSIFAFLIVEGIRHSRKPLRYLFQILILGIIIDLGTFIFLRIYIGCVLTTFFMGGLAVYFLEYGKKNYKLLFIIPFTIGVLSGFSFFPLRMQYGPYGLITILLYYSGYKLSCYFSLIISRYGLDLEEYKKTYNFTLMYVLIGSVLNFCFSGLCSIFQAEINALLSANDVDFIYQSFGALSTLFLLGYTGRRGISNKYFKWGCYLFFPIQFIIIYLIGLILH